MKVILLFMLMISSRFCVGQELSNYQFSHLDTSGKCFWEVQGRKVKDSVINQNVKVVVYKNKKIVVFDEKRYFPCNIPPKTKLGSFVMSFYIFETRQLDKLIATPIRIIEIK